MDEQATQDYMVCTGACFISSSIRGNEEKLAAYQKASDTIGAIIKNDITTRDELKYKLDEVLLKLFPQSIVDYVVKDILKVYDENIQNINNNKKLLLALESTKSSIDSGIQLSLKNGRPVKVLPKN